MYLKAKLALRDLQDANSLDRIAALLAEEKDRTRERNAVTGRNAAGAAREGFAERVLVDLLRDAGDPRAAPYLRKRRREDEDQRREELCKRKEQEDELRQRTRRLAAEVWRVPHLVEILEDLFQERHGKNITVPESTRPSYSYGGPDEVWPATTGSEFEGGRAARETLLTILTCNPSAVQTRNLEHVADLKDVKWSEDVGWAYYDWDHDPVGVTDEFSVDCTALRDAARAELGRRRAVPDVDQ